MKKITLYIYILSILALGVAYSYFPELAGLVVLAIGGAVGVLVYKKGIIWAIVPVILTTGFEFFQKWNYLNAVVMLFDLSLIGIITAFALKRKYSLRATTTAVALGLIAQMLVEFFAVKAIKGINVFDNYIQAMRESTVSTQADVLQRLKEMSYPNPEQIMDKLVKAYDMMFEVLRMLTPALLVVVASFMAYISIYLTVSLLRRQGEGLENIIPFKNIRGSSRLALALAVMLLLSTVEDFNMAGLFINIAFLITVYFIVCGLALADFFLSRKFKSLPVRLLLYISAIGVSGGFSLILSLLNPILLLLVAGIADAIFDIRKLKAKGEQNEQ